MNPLFLAELRRITGPAAVLHDPLDLMTYECDALPHLRAVPAAVVLPASAAEVQGIVRLCAREKVPFVARGHGTGLSGGALPVSGCVVIALSRLNRVLSVDIPNQRVTVEPGVTNLEITRQVAPSGYYYAPDPSSQQVCSIGGNVAENSGGAHCLKYGFTTNHVTGLEVVLPDGEMVHLGGPGADPPGYDVIGAFVGSEGTLGIATKVTVRLLRKPESVRTLLAAYDTTDQAGATEIRIAQSDAERALFWKGRKSAFAAVGRISPDYYVQDGVIPRTALPEVLRKIADLSAERGLRVANVFHAGDGNLH